MKHNQTAYLILGMLSIEPHRSGYDIRKAVESSVSYFWRESYGQIYPTLKRLAADGLIIPRETQTQGRPERQTYSLTTKGGECLREWLAAPYRDDPPRNEFLLKLFFGHAAGPGVCIQHLTDFRTKNQHLLNTLLEIGKLAKVHQAQHAELPCWLLTLSYGEAHTRASIAWSEMALRDLARSAHRPANGPSKEAAHKKSVAAKVSKNPRRVSK